VLGLWWQRTPETGLPSSRAGTGKHAGAGRPVGTRANPLGGIGGITPGHRDPLLWATIDLTTGRVPALVDTGVQLSCTRADVAEFLFLMGEPATFTECAVSCGLADGQRCQVMNAIHISQAALIYLEI
jgi:hypothetical protein